MNVDERIMAMEFGFVIAATAACYHVADIDNKPPRPWAGLMVLLGLAFMLLPLPVILRVITAFGIWFVVYVIARPPMS